MILLFSTIMHIVEGVRYEPKEEPIIFRQDFGYDSADPGILLFLSLTFS